MSWRHIGLSVQGAAHLRSGKVNQDALLVTERGGAVVAAVSDGHGGAKYVRSQEGSAIAARLVTELLLEVADSPRESTAEAWSFIKRQAEEQLPEQLVWAWRREVEAALAAAPLTDDELAAIAAADDEAAAELVRADPVLAYGATCLAALACGDFLLFLQLGDGDILVVSRSGEVTRPIPGDARLMANETTSLCSPKAWNDVRVTFCPLSRGGPPDADDQARLDRPALVLLSSDGLANSYRTPEDFLKVAADLLQMCRHDGLEQVERGLHDWLNQVSGEGSGDDVTVAILKGDEEVDIDVLVEQSQANAAAATKLEAGQSALAKGLRRLTWVTVIEALALVLVACLVGVLARNRPPLAATNQPVTAAPAPGVTP
jgi:serine/threonine protein phosphatase PrpC